MIDLSLADILMAVLGFLFTVLVFVIRAHSQYDKETRQLIHKTREEYVHKDEFRGFVREVSDLLKRIEDKLDRKVDR